MSTSRALIRPPRAWKLPSGARGYTRHLWPPWTSCTCSGLATHVGACPSHGCLNRWPPQHCKPRAHEPCVLRGCCMPLRRPRHKALPARDRSLVAVPSSELLHERASQEAAREQARSLVRPGWLSATEAGRPMSGDRRYTKRLHILLLVLCHRRDNPIRSAVSKGVE